MPDVRASSLRLLSVETTEIRMKHALGGKSEFSSIELRKTVTEEYTNGFEASLSVVFIPKNPQDAEQEELYVKVSAFFAHPEDIDQAVLLNHKVIGVFYMLFPYIRSTVSLFQSLNGMKPTLLPPLTLYGKPTEEQVAYERYTLDLEEAPVSGVEESGN